MQAKDIVKNAEQSYLWKGGKIGPVPSVPTSFDDLASQDAAPDDQAVHDALVTAIENKSINLESAVTCIETMQFRCQFFDRCVELAQAAAIVAIGEGNNELALNFLAVQAALDAREPEASEFSARERALRSQLAADH